MPFPPFCPQFSADQADPWLFAAQSRRCKKGRSQPPDGSPRAKCPAKRSGRRPDACEVCFRLQPATEPPEGRPEGIFRKRAVNQPEGIALKFHCSSPGILDNKTADRCAAADRSAPKTTLIDERRLSRSADGKQIRFVQPRRVVVIDEHQIRTSTAAEDILSWCRNFLSSLWRGTRSSGCKRPSQLLIELRSSGNRSGKAKINL